VFRILSNTASTPVKNIINASFTSCFTLSIPASSSNVKIQSRYRTQASLCTTTRCNQHIRREFCTLQRIFFFLVALQPSHHRYDLISSRGKRMRERRFIRPTRRSRPFCVSCAPPTGRRAESCGMRNARGIHVSKGLRTHLSGSANREKHDQSIPSWAPLVTRRERCYSLSVVLEVY